MKNNNEEMKYYQVRVSNDLLDELRATAKENERSLSAQIKFLINHCPRGIAKARNTTIEILEREKIKSCRIKLSDEMINDIRDSAWKNERSVTAEMNYILKCGLRGVE